MTHFKDNFRSLCDAQEGLSYWKEDTLCRFLGLPDAIGAGSVVFQMATYLGAFPFPSLAPSILTLEAMVKVVVIMTERYNRVLKRGRKDRVKLLFRSLAVFDRKMSMVQSPSEKEKTSLRDIVQEQKPDEVVEEEAVVEKVRSHVAGFAVDEPVSDEEEEEDDDELALAALDSLDAIEVYKQAEKTDRKIHHATVPVDNFRKLVMLLLVIAPGGPQENLSKYGEDLSRERLESLREEADGIIAAFVPDKVSGAISYHNFNRAVLTSLPLLFEPLNALFEHFLFSRNMDLSRRRASSIGVAQPEKTPSPPRSPVLTVPAPDSDAPLLTHALLSHLSFCLPIAPGLPNLFHAHPRFHPLYSSSTHGTSLTSLSRQVLSWSDSTLLLLSGTITSLATPITLGAYIPHPWSRPSQIKSSASSSAKLPYLFAIRPRHAIFPPNPSSHTPTLDFSTTTGISISHIIPTSTSRTNPPSPIPTPISLSIAPSLESATFYYEPTSSTLATSSFLPDPTYPGASTSPSTPSTAIDVDCLTIHGITIPDENEEDAVEAQKRKLKWQDAEAERRKGVNFGGDKEGARALLEMAGLVGDGEGGLVGAGRSGGSV